MVVSRKNPLGAGLVAPTGGVSQGFGTPQDAPHGLGVAPGSPQNFGLLPQQDAPHGRQEKTRAGRVRFQDLG